MKSATCKPFAIFLLIAVAGAAFCACEVTKKKIEIWKNSENGGAKLRAAVRDTGQKLAIRVLAAEALAELGHFGPLSEDFAALEGADRTKLLGAVVATFTARMKGEQVTQRLREQAKDALFSLRKILPAAQRAKVDADVVTWVLGDWSKRRTGEHSGAKILTAIGKAAAPIVAQNITTDPAAVVDLARQLKGLGDPRQVAVASQKLVELAGKQKPIKSDTLEAIARLAQPDGRAFALSLATAAGPAKVRNAAMLALGLMPDQSLVAPMKAIAANDKEMGELRERAFENLEKVGLPSLEALASFLTGKKEIVRYRAAEAIIACCQAKGVAKLLQTLPSRYTYQQADVKDYLEKDIRGLGKKALKPLRDALFSSSWLSRVVAVRVLGSIGTKEDLPKLQKLLADTTRLKGWGAGATVGKEAQEAIARLKKRL